MRTDEHHHAGACPSCGGPGPLGLQPRVVTAPKLELQATSGIEGRRPGAARNGGVKMRVGRTLWWGALGMLVLGLTSSCAETPEAGADGPTVTVQVAALNLIGVGDVVWDVEVVNGKAGTPDVVWRQRLASSRFGDGVGSVSYVGPCDATPGVHENTVRLWVVGVYADPVTDVGGFGEAPPVGPLTFENPTPYDALAAQWAPPLARPVTCRENADSPVRFDVALMRPADQGFFDIAVNFNDIFCSAKFDCCVESEPGCPDITLLHDGDGKRATTFVLGFACTAGTGSGVETELYLDALALDCTAPNGGTDFAADLVIDPSGPAGNQCTAGDVSACVGAVTSTLSSPLTADRYLYQVALYRGMEELPSGSAAGNKVYWNVALGVVRKGEGSVGIEDCRLRTRATADDALRTAIVDAGVIAAGAVYPIIQWDVSLGSCQAEPLTFGDPTAMVRTSYTSTSAAEGTSFAYGFGPNMGPGSFCAPPCAYGTCMGGSCICEAGWTGATCETNPDDCPVGACGAPTAGTCEDGLGTFSCTCAAGYYGTGTQACAACPAMAQCDAGALTCTGPAPEDGVCSSCAAGYAEPDCANIDECAGDATLCGQDLGHGACVDSDGSYACTCAEGYYGTGTQACGACDAVEHCTAVTCADAGASTCTACEAGYVVSGGVCVLPCGLLGQACPAGFTCDRTLDDETSYALEGAGGFCVSDGTVSAFGSGAEMVFVPAGTFWMGCNPTTDTDCSYLSDENPQHPVTLSAYAMDRTAVSAAQYKACVTGGGTGCTVPATTGGTYGTYDPAGKQTHPINNVNWTQASAYCAWRGKRLCTESEWERGARGGCETVTGTCQTSMRKYPWGNTEPTGCNEANWLGCSVATHTSDVGAYPGGTSPYGALNLSGNVWEWSSDWYGAYVAGAATNPTGAVSGSGRVIRGGYFGEMPRSVRAGQRGIYAPGDWSGAGGFRCCRSYP